MNQKGFPVTIAIIIIAMVGGLWGANAAGVFGLASAGEACGLPLPKPCQDGTICYNGVCTPTVSGGVDRWLYSISLSNLFCRGNLLASASCNIIINFAGAVIFGILAMLILILALNNVPSLPILGVAFVVGAIIGFAASSIINYFWWAILIILVFLGVIAYKLELVGG